MPVDYRKLVPLAVIALVAFAGRAIAAEGDPLPPISERFAKEDVSEEPNFQRHVSPLFGRLGCNGRSCHGSFQGRGDFRLSLFGYDFKADHEALLDKAHPRVVASEPLESKSTIKTTDEKQHKGGET